MLNILNEKIFFLINRGAGQFVWLDHFFIFVTSYFIPAMIAFVFVWFFVVIPVKKKSSFKKVSTYKDVSLFMFSLVILWTLMEFIKGMVAFPRPQQLLVGVHALSNFGSYDSFPSEHTAFAFATATFVYRYHKKTGLLLFLMAVLVGISRIFVGVHFPLDVICGALIGGAIPWVVFSVLKPYKQ